MREGVELARRTARPPSGLSSPVPLYVDRIGKRRSNDTIAVGEWRSSKALGARHYPECVDRAGASSHQVRSVRDKILELLSIESGMSRPNLKCGFNTQNDPALPTVYFPLMPAPNDPAVVISARHRRVVRLSRVVSGYQSGLVGRWRSLVTSPLMMYDFRSRLIRSAP